MAQNMPNITLSSARDIPFNKLILSQQNVRRIKAGISVEDLAEDIARRGLLTSLTVRAEVDADGRETGMFRIPAGGRRYRALERLVLQKRLSKNAAVPCIVSTSETLEVEDSLAENLQRADLHPLDQYRAFQTMREQGLGDGEIAARFFVSPAVVRQRLRLASVSPRLLALYADNEIRLEQIMAFSITENHDRQEEVWEALSRQSFRDPYHIRRLLTETAIRASDRRAVYVGVADYEAAGGVVLRDLFEQDQGGWLQDPPLLEQLAIAKLNADAERIRTEEGWKWVEAAFDFPHGHALALGRFYGEPTEWSEVELATFDRLKGDYDALDAEYAKAEAYSEETERRLEQLGAELDRLNERPIVFPQADVARGGAFVSLSANGELKVERGFLLPQDQAPVEPGDSVSIDEDPDQDPGIAGDAAVRPSTGARSDEDEEEAIRPLSDRLILDLTATRTVAMRNALAQKPAMAFTAVLHAFVLKTFYPYASETCLEFNLQITNFAQTQGLADTPWARDIEARHAAWGRDLPKDPGGVFGHLIALDEASQQALLAHCASLCLNAAVEPWNRRPRAIAHAEELALSIAFDMIKAGWKPTVDNYLGRVTKAQILQSVREARGEEAARRISHLKKIDMAAEGERLLQDIEWLPELLRAANAVAPLAIFNPDASTTADETEGPDLEPIETGSLGTGSLETGECADPDDSSRNETGEWSDGGDHPHNEAAE
ncbi:DNA-binding protein [Neorhizobium sp. P12A]|uniref:ParB/RepB/Spo0J family partition protein n=1 Tax=Neorhizobium sp. P12A TaxID=2268027 RepID=UPI0011EEB2E1|nr:ParB/RepB/Spo0J family partition protein [Neorhizobium sp. P12A]KAA0693725.1 DNA-binding protein [Neorhizobium sp. P12A]